MKSKITIRLDSCAMTCAKHLAKKRGTTVVRMVSEFLKSIAAKEPLVEKKERLPSFTRVEAT